MSSLRYVSLFSGMEAAHLAWAPLGWECAAVAEIEPAACQLLAHRLPHVPNLGSVTDITDAQIAALGPIDVVIGGSPCQDLSVAGKRAGLAGARSSLFHEQLRIFNAARSFCGARWLVWENVPGAFSSNAGRDFAVVAGAMAGTDLVAPAGGWGSEGVALGSNGLVEWCVLDAQWFGVAQRRRRVFAVLDTGNWADRGPVLLERDGLRGDSAPRREAWQGVAACLEASFGRLQGCSGQDMNHGHSHLVAFGGNNTSGPIDVATARNACASASGRMDFESETFLVQETAHTQRADGFGASEDGTGRGTPLVPVAYAIQAGATRTNPNSGPDGVGVQAEHAYTLEARAEVQCVAFDTTQITSAANYSSPKAGDPCHPLAAGMHPPAVATAMAVRRLTPRECERLQGAPDDWTLAPNKHGKPMADGPRYKMLGNSFAVPCIHWIGRQIQRAHGVTVELGDAA